MIKEASIVFENPTQKSADIMYVLGGDPIYVNKFLELFVAVNSVINQSIKNEKITLIYVNVYVKEEFLKGNEEEIQRLQKICLEKYNKHLYFNFIIFQSNLDKDKLIQQEKGVFTLLRYFNLLELMDNNPNIKHFVVSDIDAHCQFSDDINFNIIEQYDVILSAIDSVDRYGIPSYIGAGCLAIKNNQLGQKFIKNMTESLTYFNNRPALNKWNLDQASIRHAVGVSKNIKYGYFVQSGNIMRFANAYKDKDMFVVSTANMYSLQLTELNLKN